MPHQCLPLCLDHPSIPQNTPPLFSIPSSFPPSSYSWDLQCIPLDDVLPSYSRFSLWLDLPNNIWWAVQVMKLAKLQRHLRGKFRDTVWNWTTIASFHKILNSLFKNHLVIRRYKLWLIKGVIE
jgi:hypothetical protein